MTDKNRFQRFLIACSLLLFCHVISPPLQAARPKLVELKTGSNAFRGRVEIKTKQYCWLLDRDGKLNGLKLKDVKKYRTISSTFSPYPVPELKSQLAKEFGKEFKITSKGQYIICASGQHAQAYAQLFDTTYRSFKNYFSRRGFHLPKPEFPLVAIVFPDFESYANYQRKEGLAPSRGMVGYYLRTSNRVALYEKQTQSADVEPSRLQMKQYAFDNKPISSYLIQVGTRSYQKNMKPAVLQIEKQNKQLSYHSPLASVNKADNSLEATIIHEATHQIAFNTGLHSRIGDTPKWIIEGLATVFEVPGIRDTKTTVKAMQRANRERYLWFREYVSKRRKENSLSDFISSDRSFLSRNQQQILDAYGEAWALSFFLLETRPVKYARYLRKIAEREEIHAYSEKERIEDFKKVFGNGISKLETDFIRFIERL